MNSVHWYGLADRKDILVRSPVCASSPAIVSAWSWSSRTGRNLGVRLGKSTAGVVERGLGEAPHIRSGVGFYKEVGSGRSLYSGCRRSSVPGDLAALVAYHAVAHFHHVVLAIGHASAGEGVGLTCVRPVVRPLAPHTYARLASRVGLATSAGQLSEGGPICLTLGGFGLVPSGSSGTDQTEQELRNLNGAEADLTERELGNWNGAGADPTERELGNLNSAGADPTEQELGNLNGAGTDSARQKLGNLNSAGVDPTEQELRNLNGAGADPTEQKLGNLNGVGADLARQKLGNWDVARADPTEQELGNCDVARADPTEQELGNWDVARADPTEQVLGNWNGFCQG
ncbi:hypothetical protein BHM03_00058397 [Ensete ventricosum]|nr:hypothetical protein BHM03_00058397 [Ensete ventricosum]